ncbi:uncharacterized protein LOC135681185 isoform X2 [Rhopilema esculentum]|uniref:uncharacterized protein LOC135681185 isoform X2 n=1 Tax=Rhopilema esculentum TaxID=499914 RepID=UPI0031E027AD
MCAKIPKTIIAAKIILFFLLAIDIGVNSQIGPLDSFKAHVYSFGIDDPANGGSTLSKVNVYGKKNNNYVYEYKTKTNLKSGFLIVVINKYSGYVEFEKSFDATVANSSDTKKLARFLNELPQERIVLGGVYKDGQVGTDGNQELIKAFSRILGEAMHKLYYGGAYFFQGHTRLRDDKNPPDFQKALERKRGPGIYQTLAAVTPNVVNIKISSLGCDDPGPHRPKQEVCHDVLNTIAINGINHSPQKVGLNIVFMSRELGHVFATEAFDFSKDKKEESRFASFVYSSPPNTIVLGSVKGDASKNFGVMGLEVLQSVLGRTDIPTFRLRSAYTFIGVHGATEGFHEEARSLRQFNTADRYLGGVTTSISLQIQREIDVEIISKSCEPGSCATSTGALFKINGQVIESKGRGFTFLALNAANGKAEQVLHADTHGTAVELEDVLKPVPKVKILLGLVKEDAFRRLTEKSLKYLEEVWIGEPVALNALYDAYAFIGMSVEVKPNWLQQKKAPKTTGTATIKTKIPMATRECFSPNNPKDGKAKQRIYAHYEDAEYECGDGTIFFGDPDKCMADGSWRKSEDKPVECRKEIDECKEGTAKCPQNSNCRNLPGSYECVCKPGYARSLHGKYCVYRNTCEDSQCLIPDTKCGIVNGSFTCVCNVGYVIKNEACVDQDECMLDTSSCSPSEICLNTAGSYRCKKCASGFIADLKHKSCTGKFLQFQSHT